MKCNPCICGSNVKRKLATGFDIKEGSNWYQVRCPKCDTRSMKSYHEVQPDSAIHAWNELQARTTLDKEQDDE